MSMPSIVDLAGLAPVKVDPVTVSIRGGEVALVPIGGADELAIRSLLPRPAWPTKRSPGGSLAPMVPIDRHDPEWAAFEAAVTVNLFEVKCAIVVACVAAAQGQRLEPAKAVAGGRELGQRWSEREIDGAYQSVQDISAVPTMRSLAMAETAIITRRRPGQAEAPLTAEQRAALEEGSDGADGTPWSPGTYDRELGYYIRRAAEYANMTPRDVLTLSPQERDQAIAYARLRMWEDDNRVAAVLAAMGTAGPRG